MLYSVGIVRRKMRESGSGRSLFDRMRIREIRVRVDLGHIFDIPTHWSVMRMDKVEHFAADRGRIRIRIVGAGYRCGIDRGWSLKFAHTPG